jgi:hypothetical protein
MPCDTSRKPEQTIEQRADEIRRSISGLSSLLATGKVRAKVGPQGAIAFIGWSEADRGRVTDACAYRRIMATGSAMAKAQIAQAEMMAGRTVDRIVVGQGIHSHDNGRTWHGKG